MILIAHSCHYFNYRRWSWASRIDAGFLLMILRYKAFAPRFIPFFSAKGSFCILVWAVINFIFYRLLLTSHHSQHTMSFCWWQPPHTPVSVSAWKTYQWRVNISTGCLLLLTRSMCLGNARSPHSSRPNLLYSGSSKCLRDESKRATFRKLPESKEHRELNLYHVLFTGKRICATRQVFDS